ncbi:MAG: nucleotide exchange factor GrpE [Chloroflexota bacterium]|nr:nucleotide exchange factor GrpE [Chloroflexota bacterium]
MRRRDPTSPSGRGMSLGECQVALQAAQQEVAELRDKYLRAAASLENARRQAERDAAARVTDRLRQFSLRLLDVADNLERALQHAPEGDALRPGVEATLQQLRTALRHEGVTPIPVEPGAAFDPRYHEAISGYPGDVAHDTVVEVSQTGYTFDGQVLRPARVVVAMPARRQA